MRHGIWPAIAAVCLVFAALPAGAAETWARVIGGSGHGALFDMVFSDDGQVLAVGATNHVHTPTREGDVLLIRLTVGGEILWERTWGGTEFEQAWSVASAPAGGFYVFGETASFGAGERDFFLLRIDDDGDEIWVHTYGGPKREWPFGMLVLADGELLIYGSTIAEAGGREAPYALRVAADGEVLWEFADATDEDRFISGAAETPQRDLVLCMAGVENGGLMKLTADGQVLWSRMYDLSESQYPTEVLLNKDGGFLLAGYYAGQASRQLADVWLARCSPSGELEWQKTFGSRLLDDYALSLQRLANGAVLIGGFGFGMPLWCVSESGEILWESHPMRSFTYGAFGLLEMPDGSLLVSGMRMISRSADATILRVDQTGQLVD